MVVTGSSGCLGHATVRLLIGRDEQVAEIRCLDLIRPSEFMLATIEEDLSNECEQRRHQSAGAVKKSVHQFRGDIRDINVVERVLAGAHCVIHCAALVDFWTDTSEQDADELESINVHGTENLLKACVRLGVPKFVHVSSFETFTSYHTIYYATESTIPDTEYLLFGPSGATKKEAEAKVRQYANVKLRCKATPSSSIANQNEQSTSGADESRVKGDSLNAVIIRFTPIYGEHDKHYVSKILRLTKFFNGTLQRFTNIWIRQQPIYVGNAAWALVKAKQRMDVDESISGEGKCK